jgi:hypothetical protein
MNRLTQGLLLTIVGLAVLAAASPGLIKLAGALTPLVLVVGTVVAVLQLTRYFTRR